MAEAPFLHIRSPDLGQPPRVLQLDRPSLRIGLGPRCDLALADPSLAEVHCILRRRGDDWTVQPIGPPGRMTLDGRAVETILRLPPGATLRIGRFTLRLVDPRPAARFGAYSTPPIVAPDPDLPVEDLPRAFSTLASPTPRPTPVPTPTSPLPPVAPERERLARWQPRQMSRPDLSPREEWTARWERAGREIRSRATTRPPTTPTPATPRAPVHEAPTEPPVNRAATPEPVRETPTEPPVPPAATAPVLLLALPAPAANLATSPVVEPEPEPQPEVLVATAPIAPPLPAAAAWPPDEPEHVTESIAETPPPSYLVSSDFELESATWRDLVGHRDAPAEAPAPEPVPPPVESASTAEIEPTPPEPEVEPEPEPEVRLPDPLPPASEHRDEESAPPRTALPTVIARTEEQILLPPPRPTVAPAPTPTPTPTPTTESLAALAGVSEWPSAKVILEQYRRDKPSAPSAPQRAPNRPSRPLPQPTTEYAPRSWTIPGRLGVGLAASLALLVGTGMLALSWSWSQDDRLAGVLANQLVRPDPPARRVALPETPPAKAWWRSTSDHLYLHALARAAGSASDPTSADEIRELLDAARSASPLQRQVRLARIDGDDPGVGLSRDALALRQSGKRLLREEKIEAALRAYHLAIQATDQVDLDGMHIPAFDDAMDVRRFRLPGESFLTLILNDLAAAEIPAEVRSRWYDALPRHAVIGLALYRFHHARGETPIAEQAARLALEAAPPSRPAARALHEAAQAELLALQGRLEEAAEHYHAAIAAIPEGEIQRTWALNLGELESRLEHDDQARAAWSLARGDDPSDPINVRLVEARRRRGHLEPPTLLVTPSSQPTPPDTEVQQAGFERRLSPPR